MPISDKELLFNSLVQTHWDNFARETLALIKRDNTPTPQVFISYAWPKLNEERDIQAWLLSLHERLTYLGVKVFFDIKSMMLGINIDEFMQQGVTNSDTILIIGTETYHNRSKEATNVQREVELIRQKVAAKGTGCVIPILYRGQFQTALPALGTNGTFIQVLGTDCHDELLYHKNLPGLIESLFQLQGHAEYQTVKRSYLSKLQDIEAQGLSDVAIADFAQQRAQKARDALVLQQEAVNLMLERNAKGHPDYVARPPGSESLSVKLLSHLKTKYSQYTHVQALFGEPMALEGQYINVQMLYQVLEEQELTKDDKKQEGDDADKDKEFKDARIISFESLFSKKEPLEIKHLFTPAKTLLSQKQKTNEARPELPPNLVLLQGRAGIGKTTFVNFVTREWALGRLWQEYNWVFSLRLRDLRSGAYQQAADRKETWRLEDWIYQSYFAAQMDKSAFLSLWTWLIEPDFRKKKVLFILDGYDETPNHHPCEQALTDLLNGDMPKILTSRPYGLSDLPKDRRELEIVGFVDANVEKYVALYFKHNTVKAQDINTGLKAIPTLWGSAHIPVTLNVICGVLETEQDISGTLNKLNTMSSLYETMELSLLERAYLSVQGQEKEHAAELRLLDKKSKYELLTAHYKTLRHYLGKLAFEAFSKQQLILTPQHVNDALEALGVPVNERAAKIKALLELGLLKKILDDVTHEETNYEFLHLTFQEYYAGHHILWIAEQNNGAMIDDFAKIKLDPRYQLVLWFVAGTIKDKNQFNVFMRGIAAPVGGDMLGNVQLGLMVRCTAENWELAQQTGWSKSITKMLQKRIQGLRERFKRGEIDSVKKKLYVFQDLREQIESERMPPPVWVQMINLFPNSYQVQMGAQDLLPDALPTISSFFVSSRETSARFIVWLSLASPTILNTLAKLMVDSNFEGRFAALCAIDKLGPAAATKEFLAQLAKLLANNDEYIRKVVGMLGAAAATPEFLDQLAKLLVEGNYGARKAAVDTIGILGPAAATKEFLAQLAKLLDEYKYSGYVLKAAVDAIGKLGPAAATMDIIAELHKLMVRSIWRVDLEATDAIGKLGPAVATKDILAALYKQLVAGNRNAIDAIGNLGAVAATEEILAQLHKLLAESSKGIRKNALSAMGKLGVVAATKEFLAQLPKLLVDSDQNVRAAAVDAIGMLGAVVVTKEIIAQLPKLLVDSDQNVRAAAVDAIGRLGAVVVTKEILEQLPKLLVDSDQNVRKAAVGAIGMLGAVAATKEFLAQLAKILAEERSKFVREYPLEAIGKLGAVAATKEFLALLIKLLEDSNEGIREAAVCAIGKLGAAAATSDFLAQLAKLFVDNNQEVRKAALFAVGNIGSAAATSDILAQLPKLLVDSDQNVRKAAVGAIGMLGAVVVTKEILEQLPKLLQDRDQNNVRAAAFDAIGMLGSAAATKDILAWLHWFMVNTDKYRCMAVVAIGNIGPTAATPDILTQLPKLLENSDKEIRKAAGNSIVKLGSAAATQELIVELIRLLAHEQFFVEHILSNLVSTYLSKKATTNLPETPLFPVLATALITGAYLSGNTSFRIDHEVKTTTYNLRGFADKTAFNISITHAQAQWFIYWTQQIIQSTDEGTLGRKLAEIEKAGMKVSSQNSLAWFDQASNNSSSSSGTATGSYYAGFFQPKAYGLSNDAVVAVQNENEEKCMIM